jgi:hypothetical protein
MKMLCLKFAVLALVTPLAAHAQFGSGIVFDPTQSGHAIEQIAQANQLFTTTVKLADNAIATYNVVHQMSLVPQSLYQPYLSPWSYWTILNHAANTYGNSQAWISSANNGQNAVVAYQQASLPSAAKLNGYQTLSAPAQQEVAAQGATVDLQDAVSSSNLQTLGTIRTNSERRQTAIDDLQAETQSPDPAQHTEMATLQRINQALILELQQQQEANQIAQAYALQTILAQKQQQDALKAAFQRANQFETDYTSNAPSYSGAAAAMRY